MNLESAQLTGQSKRPTSRGATYAPPESYLRGSLEVGRRKTCKRVRLFERLQGIVPKDDAYRVPSDPQIHQELPVGMGLWRPIQSPLVFLAQSWDCEWIGRTRLPPIEHIFRTAGMADMHLKKHTCFLLIRWCQSFSISPHQSTALPFETVPSPGRGQSH